MDSNNPNPPGPKYDPVTGQPLTGDDAAAGVTPPSPPPISQPEPVAPQEFRVASTNGDTGPSATPPAPGPAYPPTQPSSYPPTQQGSPPPTTPQPQAPYGAQPQYGQPYQQPQQPYYGPPPQQTNVNKPRRSAALPLLLGALALLLIGAGIATWYFLNQAGIIGNNSAAIERALPANTLAYFQIDPNPSEAQRRSFDKMREAFESQPGFKEAIERMSRDATEMATSSECFPAPEGTGLDALSSYLGDSITVAVLPPSTDDLNTIKAATENGEPGEIMPAVSRNIVGLVDLDFNPLNKKGPLVDIKKIVDEKTQLVETYEGTDIRKYTCQETTLYFGLLNGTTTAAVGADLAPVKRIIDEFKANKGLKEDNTYKFLSGKVPADRVATFYVNMSEIMRYAETIAPEPFSTGQMPKVQGGFLMTLSGQDDGLQFDVASEVKAEGVDANLASLAGTDKKPDASTLTDIPANSLGFVMGTDLKTIITGALDSMEKQNPEQVDEITRQVQEATGLDLRNDILPLLGGDFALSISRGNVSRDNLDLPVVFQLKLSADDRPKAADALRKIAEHENFRGVQMFEAAGGTFYEFNKMAAIGVSSDRLIVVALTGGQGDVRALLNTVTDGFGKGLGTTDKWKDASRHLPADSNMIFHVDITGIREVVETTMSEASKDEYEENTAPFVRPFKYVLMGSANDPIRENEPIRGLFRLFIGISK